MLTRTEKEKRVIELYEQGYTYRAIAKEVHLSPGSISSIIKKHTGEQGPEKVEQQKRHGQGQEQIIDTKVFKLFEEGKTPIQVAIDLNLPSVEVTRLQGEYWRLKGLHELDQLYEEIGDDVFQLHRTYNSFKDKGYTLSQLFEAADHLDELPLLRSEHQRLEQDNQNLRNEQKQLTGSILVAKENLSAINIDSDVKVKELEQLRHHKLQVQKALVNMNTGPGYQRLIGTAEAVTANILKQNPAVIGAAIRAVFQALEEEPRNELQTLIFGSLTYPMYEPTNCHMPQNYLQRRQAALFKAAEEMYTDLLAKCVNTTVSSVLNVPYGPSYQATRRYM